MTLLPGPEGVTAGEEICRYILSLTGDGQNANCLNAMKRDTRKAETWLVFILHGYNVDADGWVINLGESIRRR